MDLRGQLQNALGSRYILERELGGGGMSRVFVAEETALRRRVVVKVLAPELIAGVNVERFKREILLSAGLQHPHIVPVHSAGEMEGTPYFTMPFVEGQSLRARLMEGPLSISEALSILRDVARALAYAHARGIVHRDIKPDNVLLSGGSATVTDFGIAKAISAARATTHDSTLTQLGTSIGTPAYMAPEQVAGDSDIDHRADIYSFGCLAYEMLVGRPPFVEKSAQRIMAAHMSAQPVLVTQRRSDTPQAIAELVMRCLSKEPQLRPQGAGDLVAVLESVASGGLSSPSVNVPGEPTMLRKVLAVYAASFVGVAILARTAIVAIGLPDWVFPGALVVMALGLPVILVTAYAHYAIRRAATRTPTFTPGGTPSKAHGPIATLAVRAGSHLSWRRAFIGGVYAFAAFTTFIVGFMGLRTLGIGPAGSLLGKGELKARDRLLVTDFHVSAADSNYGPVVGELVAMRLSESPSVSVMSRMMLVDALARMSRSPRSTIDLDLARELASREGVKAIVDGTIVRIGTSLAVTMRLVTPDSGRELFSDQAVATSEEKLIPVVDHLSRELRRKIGESLKSVRASPPLEQVATPSLAALRLYTTASRLHFGGEGVRAIPLLRQAVAIDTEFATAYRMMGSAMRNAGLSRASSDSALAAAFRFRARLTEAERYRMLTTYYGNGPGRNRAEAIRAHETLLEMGDSLFLNSFGVFLTTRQEFARAETLYRAAIAKGFSGVLPYNNLGIALVNQGKWSEARTAAAAAIAKAPTAPGPVRFPILLLYHGGYQTGRLESYRHALDRLRSSESTPNRIWAIDRLCDLAVQQGALATAEKLYTEARSLDSSSGQTAPELSHVLRRVYIERIRGRRERAVERLDAELRKRPLEIRPEADRPYLAIANAYADLGDALRARAMLAQYQRQVTDTARKREDAPQTQYTLGLIALAEGRGAEASLHFKRSSQQPDGPATFCTACGFREIGEAFVVAGQTDSAIAMFERYLRTPWSERMTLLFDPISLAKVHRELAELYSLHADPESKRKAIEHNRLFIELWKDADVDLQSEVRNARIRLAELEPKVDARPPRILRGAGSSKQR